MGPLYNTILPSDVCLSYLRGPPTCAADGDNWKDRLGLESVVCLAFLTQRPKAQVFKEAKQISVRISDDKLSIACFLFIYAIPSFLHREHEWHAMYAERCLNGSDVRNLDLEIDSAAEGIGVRQMPVIKVSSDPDLVDHQFGRSQAQVGKALFRPLVVDIEAQDITVEA